MSLISSIEAAGGTAAKLKEMFDGKTDDQLPEKVKQWVGTLRNRMSQGAMDGLRLARFWRAMDNCYEESASSVTISMVRDIIASETSQEAILSKLKSYGVQPDQFLIPAVDASGKIVPPVNGQQPMKFDFPTFFRVAVPLVSYYTGIRRAKIVTDVTGVHPLYGFQPAALTEECRLQCDLITQVIEQQASNMGYREDEADSIEPTLKYGQQISFPKESYFRETHEIEGKEEIVREGVRWFNPHRTRWFVDKSEPLYRLNTDTGPKWGGYWDIFRFSDLDANENIWNRNAWEISGEHWYAKGFKAYQEIYPCQIKMPAFSFEDSKAAAFKYAQAPADAGVPVTVMFDKVVPNSVGLYGYKHAVWHRIMFAGDTVINVEPWAYCPMVAYLYDNDSRRERNVGLGAELAPFQDLIGQFLSQYVLAAKQNFLRITFFDKRVVKEEDIKRAQNMGEKSYRSRMFIGYEPNEMDAMQRKITEAFFTPDLPAMPAGEALRAVDEVISLMERMLGFTPAEVGTSASHELSAKEVTIIDQHSGTRIGYTEGWIYAAVHAKKWALHRAFMEYGSDEVIAIVANMNDVKRSTLEKMGYKVELDPKTREAGVSGKKAPLSAAKFSNTRDGSRRAPEGKVAAAMINIFQMLFSSQALVETVGARQLLMKFNEILNWAGVPGTWRFETEGDVTPERAQAQLDQMAQAFGPMIKGELEKYTESMRVNLVEPLKQQIGQATQMAGESAQAVEAVSQAVGQQAQAVEAVSQAVGQQGQQIASLEQAVVKISEEVGSLVQMAGAAMTPQPGVPEQAPIPGL